MSYYDGRTDDARRTDPQGDRSCEGVQPRVGRGEFLGEVAAVAGSGTAPREVAPAASAAYVDSRNAPAEIVQAIREQKAKLNVLQEERTKVWHEMTEAIAAHTFMDGAVDKAERKLATLDYDLRQAIAREAKALVA